MSYSVFAKFYRHFWPAIVVSAVSLASLNESAKAAQVGRFTFEWPIYRDTAHPDLVQQVEPFLTQQINQRFQQNPQLDRLEILMMVNRQGDVLPLLTTTVSRQQWQRSPQIRLWSQYHSAYAGFQRPQSPLTQRPIGARRRSDLSNWPAIAFAIDQARDRRQLAGQLAQQYLSHLD